MSDNDGNEHTEIPGTAALEQDILGPTETEGKASAFDDLSTTLAELGFDVASKTFSETARLASDIVGKGVDTVLLDTLKEITRLRDHLQKQVQVIDDAVTQLSHGSLLNDIVSLKSSVVSLERAKEKIDDLGNRFPVIEGRVLNMPLDIEVFNNLIRQFQAYRYGGGLSSNSAASNNVNNMYMDMDLQYFLRFLGYAIDRARRD